MKFSVTPAPGARRRAVSSVPLVVAASPYITVLGVPAASVAVTISLGGSMVTTLTGVLDASGTLNLLPPYNLPDGARTVTAIQTISGSPSAPSAPAVLTMPNAAKSQVLSIIDRMTVAPPAGRAEAMYALISDLMESVVWPRLDLLALLAAHHEQASRLNWIGPNYDLQYYNGPTFTANRGWRGGSTAWMDVVGYNPSATPSKFSLNDALAGLWVLTPSEGLGIDLSGIVWMSRRNAATADWHYRINDSTSSFGTPGNTPGLYVGDRPSSSTKRLFKNGAQIATHNVASSVLNNRLNILGQSGGNNSSAELAVVFAGASLTETQHAALYAALNTYLTTVGAFEVPA